MTTPSLEQAKQELMEAAEQLKFWNSHYDELLSTYPDQFVAMKDGQIVGAEPDLLRLIAVLGSKHIDIRDTRVRFITADYSKLIL